MTAPTKGTGPDVRAPEPAFNEDNGHHSRDCAVIQPSDITAALAGASLAQLFQLLDPTAGLRALVANGAPDPVPLCPACGRRGIEIVDSTTAWCSSGCRWTRWSLTLLVLADVRAVHAVASAIAAERGVA